MSSNMSDWTTPDFLTSLAQDTTPAQAYVDQFHAFLKDGNDSLTVSPSAFDNQRDSSPSSSTSNAPAVSPQDLQIQSRAHEQQRHDKRKADIPTNSTSTVKDRRASDGADRLHTHGDVDFAEGTSEDDGSHPTGKKGKNSDKRRAQNRQAQRNFRERKERHLKELEERVVSLEQQANDSMSENSVLKQLVQRLQSENELLKGGSSGFSFSYDKDVSGSLSMPRAPAFGGAPLPPPPEHPRMNSSSSASSSPTTHRSSSISTDASSVPPSMSNSTAHTPTLASISPPAIPAAATARSALDDALFMGNYAPSPASTTGESASSSNHVATPPETNAASTDLFRSYREPSVGQYGDLDDLFASVAPLTQSLNTKTSAFVPGLSDVDDFSSFLKSPSPLSAGLTPPSDNPSPASSGAPTSKNAVVASSGLLSGAVCPLTGEPNPDYREQGKDEKYVFDVDSLCADMQAKAVCQEKARQALADAMAQDAQTAEKLFKGTAAAAVADNKA